MRSPAPRRDTPPPAPGRVVTRTTDALLNAASWAFRQWKRNAENTIIEAADVVMGLVGGGNLGDEARDVGKYRETSYLTTAINAALLVSPPGTRTAALEGRSVLTIATPELPLGSTAGAAQRGALEPGRLAAIGPQTWESSAGLIYAPGSQHGNRVRHVLTHAAPDPSKMMHNVFAGGTKAVLPVIDEAWIMRGSPVPGDPGAFIVPMGRVVGTAGETSIKIVVRPGTEYIITAYPVFP